MAAPLPRLREWRTTFAPLPPAMRPVASTDPSSTTTTRSTPGSDAAASTVAAIRSCSSLAAIMTAVSACMKAMVVRLGPSDGRYGIVHGEHRVEAGHLKDPAYCRTGRRELQR